MTIEIDEGIKNTCLLKMFERCKTNNFDYNFLNTMKESMIFDIEELLVKLETQLWLPIEKNIFTGIDKKKHDQLLYKRTLAYVAREIFNMLEPTLLQYIDINKHREKYFQEEYCLVQTETLLRGSIAIVRNEIVNYNLTKMEREEIEEILIEIDYKISFYGDDSYVEKAHLVHFYNLLKGAKIHYIDRNKAYYPVIVGMILDFAGHLSARNIANRMFNVSTATNNYGRYLKKIDNTYLEKESITKYRFTSYQKQVRFNQIKMHILSFYIKETNNTTQLCELFRKIFVKKIMTNSMSFSQKIMKAYMKKTTLNEVGNYVIMGQYTREYLT